MICKLYIVSLIISLISFDAIAKLLSTELDAFVYNSEFIVRAAVLEVYPKHAVLEIKDIYKGERIDTFIKINWGSEEHDQNINTVGTDYLLFLKKLKNKDLTGTHYGRSYWPIDYTYDESNTTGYVHYIYPLTTVKIKTDYFSKSDKVNNRNSDKHTETWIDLTKLLPDLNNISDSYEQNIITVQKKKKKYDELLKNKKQAVYPDCPEYMFFNSEHKGDYQLNTCRGFLDKNIEIQNGWTARYQSGNSYSNQIVHYKNGNKHGPIKVIFEDGDWWEGFYNKGELEGKRTYWYSNGNKWNEGVFNNGKLDGEFLTWYINGSLKEIAVFTLGQIESTTCWDNKGFKNYDEEC